MPKSITPHEWLKKLNPAEIDWLATHLTKTKQLRPKPYSSTQDQFEHLLDRLERSFENTKLFKTCRNSICQKRSRAKNKKHSYEFRLTPEEFGKLQELAKRHGTNRTEMIRRLIHADLSPLKEAQQVKERSKRAQRDLALKRDDMKTLVAHAVSVAEQLADQLASARVGAFNHSEQQLALFQTREELVTREANLLKEWIKERMKQKEQELRKQLHNLPGSIQRPAPKKNTRASSQSQVKDANKPASNR